MSDPPGLDLRRLAAYLGVDHLTGSVIAGGRSNLTYRVTDGQSRWVVRRPPLGHVLPTAHDMAREYRVISALRGTPVPVPKVVLYCADESVIGAPFYVMEEVPGVVLRSASDFARLPDGGGIHCGRVLVEVLLALHRIQPAAVGLGDFGRPEGYLARQVSRWYRQWERSATRELPSLEKLHARLASSVPESDRASIVHGDYRLDNVLFDPTLTRIDAVLDWEMSTLGDPLADVGLLYTYTALAAEGLRPGGAALPASAGFPPAAQLMEWYAAGSGTSLERLAWYAAFGHYKLAVISEGIHARFLAGETVGDDFESIGAQVPQLVERALAHLEEA
ncbi:MAG: phosphotransferase family protein [Micromonosporaceae bacterium]|jgi:aminoglycoside phosphotransferase (APT) family kinase protein|nr:phosphotransferase family protein [Micromonosporaceae bacterium]